MKNLSIVAIALFVAACSPDTIVTTTITSPTPVFTPVVTGVSNQNPTQNCPTGNCQSTCPTGNCTGTGTPNLGSPASRSPEILSFGSDTARIAKHNAAVLRWEISDTSANVRIDPSIGSVASVGFIVVFPTQTTTYTLTARNDRGIAQRQFTIVVFSPE